MSAPFHDIGYAKINLALHVRARRADGYHELETLFAFAEAGDVLSAAPADDISLSITGPFAAGLSAEDDNLVIRAARLLADQFQIQDGIAFTLEKNLPIAAGIGGGSADAAAALRLAARLWGLPENGAMLHSLASQLGADVPSCLTAQSCFGTGTGTELTAVDIGIAGQPILLVNPGLPCPTGPVFQAWDGQDRGPLDPFAWRSARNDLEPPARALVPRIADVLLRLGAQPGVSMARMSGSGATCFALFDTNEQRDEAAIALQIAEPNWWVLATQLR